VNHAALLSAETLAEMLNLHSVPDDPDQARRLGNQRRVEAIETVSSRLETFFLKGRPVSGSRVELTVDPAGFASSGDLHLFGDVLDHFLGAFHHINTYSRLSVIGSRSREVITWPPRLGPKRLL
jgi:type VI secretion system protein ImpG